MRIHDVEVEVEGTFGSEGEPARNVTYDVKVSAEASESDIKDLMRHTDRVAEIQNTLRVGIPISLKGMDVSTV
jgi:hypothetical protein